jgi:hypothetical protein
MSESCLYLLLLMLMLFLPILAELEAEAVFEHFTNRFKRHALDVRVEENDKQPSEKTNAAVETECSRRCDSLHHGEKCTADDDVCAPASTILLAKVVVGQTVLNSRYSVKHSSQSTSLVRDQLSPNPSNSRYTCGVKSHIADDRNENQSAGPSDCSALNFQCRQVDRNKAE